MPIISNSLIHRVGRMLVWNVTLVCFAFILLVLALNYVVLPNIDDFRPRIEQWVSEKTGQSVRIGRIEASWSRIYPDLTLRDVRVMDAEGQPALAFSRVEAVLSWKSVPSARLELRRLEIDEPTLHLRRSEDGRFFIAGILVDQGSGEADTFSWLLAQQVVRIRDATLLWQDDMRKAPVLTLEDLNLVLDNSGEKHRFALTASPPQEFASRIDIRGDVRGKDPHSLAGWSGQFFAEIDYADLAIWNRWVDYPLSLSRGRGALRTWLTFADKSVREVTADVTLQDVEVQVSPDLRTLALTSFSGRLQATFLPTTGGTIHGRGIELFAQALHSDDGSTAAPEPIRIEPTDFTIHWSRDAGGEATTRHVELTRMDTGALARLAGCFPIDVRSRQWLADYAPSGRVSDLNVRWQENKGHLQDYSLKANIQDIGIKSNGAVPGFSGMSGSLEADEKGGKVTLNSGASSIDLPMVFSESLTRLDSLNAQASWKVEEDTLEVVLSHAEFSNSEAAGSAKGIYRATGTDLGFIDMTAELTRADARAVWRYLPDVVDVEARHWLRDSLLAGQSTEAKLILKGNLQDFPFLDEQFGQFLVTVKARDAILDYGDGWPRIENIHGDLRFKGAGMEIDAQQGKILGTVLSKTHVVIPDFDAPIPILYVKGQVDGPTAEFLKFIDQSPVADEIDRFTEDMRATGNGRLAIDLTIPLSEEKLDESKVSGTFQLINNEVTLDAALPPLQRANGNLRFSRSTLNVGEINAVLLGGPLKIKGGTQKDGNVLFSANGVMDIEQLRQQTPYPLLTSLSGATPYRGEVRINKRNADLRIESDLVGLSSMLPVPFAKAESESLPFIFEKKLLPANAVKTKVPSIREQISISLGSILSAQLVRQKSPTGFTIEKGAVSVGSPLELPEKGLSLNITSKQLDLDAWQKVLVNGEKTHQGNTATLSLLPDVVRAKTEEMTLRGVSLKDVDLVATHNSEQWKIHLNSQQAVGDIFWRDKDDGRLIMRLKKLMIDDFTPSSEPGESTKKLPALDIIADDFSVRRLHFGRLELQAENNGELWNLSRIQASNSHGHFVGSGHWRHINGQDQTHLDFKIDSDDVGKLLDRMGYPKSVRGGSAHLEGSLGWKGPPTEIDYASMSGNLSVEATKGQFLKLDPGAAGKLLGLISLQNLPRRITLDFRDVFSAGFAFDAIAGKVAIQQGVMRTTDPLLVSGPSAQVIMQGEVDLKQELQHLTIKVLPEVGDTAALGVAIVNPVAGVATWLANKILQNPLSNMFGYNYLVTGTWDDPKVEKLPSASPGEVESSYPGPESMP